MFEAFLTLFWNISVYFWPSFSYFRYQSSTPVLDKILYKAFER